MKKFERKTKSNRLGSLAFGAGLASLILALALSLTGGVTLAAPLGATAPGLGQAGAFSVIGKAAVTNGGPSVLSGNVGADSSITGFPPGSAAALVFAPEVNGAEADAATADGGLTSQAGGATLVGPNLTGLTLVPGVYNAQEMLLPGELILDGPGVYVFLTTAITAAGSVTLINGARPCDVFWHVDSSAGLVGGSFVGTIIAGISITFGDGVALDGRALAMTGNVTLLNNSISGPSCPAAGNTATPSQSSTPGPSPTPVATATNVPTFPSYVDVVTQCAVNGIGEVRVGLSAGVIVYGLGPDITSATDTGANKIIRFLPVGHYDWHAVPPANHYMQTASSGSIDIVECPAPGPAATSVPGATAAPTSAPSATAVSILIPSTGADLAGEQALAHRQWMRVGLVLLGLGLVIAGYTLRRKQSA